MPPLLAASTSGGGIAPRAAGQRRRTKAIADDLNTNWHFYAAQAEAAHLGRMQIFLKEGS